MLWISRTISKIESLVNEGTPSSLAYAALEARLAIERVCYERLVNAHSYISHADLKNWQPAKIVMTLIEEVEPKIASSFTLSISKKPTLPHDENEYQKHEYIKVGEQIGLNPDRLGKLWNALGSFLHVQVPSAADKNIEQYPDAEKARSKIKEAIDELKKLSRGTLIASGIGPTVSFLCDCGTTNKRRADLIHNGQVLSCINALCSYKWEVCLEGEEITFTPRVVSIPCHHCGAENNFPEKKIVDLCPTHRIKFSCDECKKETEVFWRLVYGKREKNFS